MLFFLECSDVRILSEMSIEEVSLEDHEFSTTEQQEQEQQMQTVRRRSTRVLSKLKSSGSEVLQTITQKRRRRRECGTDDLAADEMPSEDAVNDPTTGEHRCLIFAQHTSVLDVIERSVLQRYFPSVSYVRMDGSTPPVKRAEIARRFNDQLMRNHNDDEEQQSSAQISSEMTSNAHAIHRILRSQESEVSSRGRHTSASKDNIRILLMTSRSCGLGLNLTAADTVIFVQHDWNPFVDLQVFECFGLRIKYEHLTLLMLW